MQSCVPGQYVSVLAQMYVRTIAIFLDMQPRNTPKAMIQRNWKKFDVEGKLQDDKAREWVRALLVALVAWPTPPARRTRADIAP